jgi:hypothetical protein
VIPHPHDLTLRPITGPDELDLFNRLPYVLNDEVGGDLAAGRRRPEWLWLALRGDRVVARAGWWSRAGDQHPQIMDIFDIDGDTGDGVRLLKTALPAVVPADATPPEYCRFLAADWRDHQCSRQAVEYRLGALERVGAKLFVERLRLEWRPGTPVAGLSGRLIFRPVRNPGELIELMTLVLDGTLDAHSRDDLTRMTPPSGRTGAVPQRTRALRQPARVVADRDAAGRRTSRIRDPRAQRLQPDHRLPRSGASASRSWLHSRRARGGYEPARSAERTANPVRHRRR